MSKRIIFTFDDQSAEALRVMVAVGKLPSQAGAVRTALETYRALQQQVARGYSDILVRHPETLNERVLIVPSLAWYAQCVPPPPERKDPDE